MSSQPVVIIAYGNPVRSDDGLAWHAAKQLARLPATEIHCVQQLMPEIAEVISHARLLIFMDAAETGLPGEVSCIKVGDGPQSIGGTSHYLSPAELVALARLLYGATPEAFSITVCGENFDHGETLSPRIEAAIPHVVKAIADLVKGNR